MTAALPLVARRAISALMSSTFQEGWYSLLKPQISAGIVSYGATSHSSTQSFFLP